MARKNSKKSAVASDTAVASVINVDTAPKGEAVGATDIVSLDAGVSEAVAALNSAHGGLGGTITETDYVKPEDVLVDFDDRTVADPEQHKKDIDLAVSLFLHGQKQPAIVVKDEIGGPATVIAGRTRRRAVKLLNEGFDAIDPRTGETVRFHNPDFRLWVGYDKAQSKEEAFVAALETNIKVNALNTVQEAYAVKRLTGEFGWTLTEAASKFGYNNTNRQAKLVKLLELEEAVIERVAANKLSLDAAVSTSSLSPEKRLAAITSAEDADGRVDGGKLRDHLRDVFSVGDGEASAATGVPTSEGSTAGGEGTDEATKPAAKKDKTAKTEPAGPSLSRNVAAFKKFVDSVTTDEDSDVSEPAKELLKAFTKWFAGVKFGDTALKNALKAHVKAK